MEASATHSPLFVSIKRNLSIEASHDLRIKKIRKIVLVKNSIIKRRVNVIKRIRIVRSKPTDKIQRKVQKLKKLIPSNSDSDESTAGLEGLFRDTADYILSLQTRVRFMQMMVNALTTPGSS